MNKKIELKRVELNNLKKELDTIKQLPYGGIPLAVEAKRVEKKYKQLEKELQDYEQTNDA